MKKLLSIILVVLVYGQSFAYNFLQETPPPPPPNGDGTITPQGDPGAPGVPINFIVPFLCISAICLTIYFIRKNKLKTV